jgi:hypothetical protein
MADFVESLMADFRAGAATALARIHRMRDENEEEGQFLEFKDLERQPGIKTLEDDVKKTLAKQMSGFANGGGGVLIWGIKAPNDIVKELRPISNLKRFRYLLEEHSSKALIPPLRNVEHIAIFDPEESDCGYVVTCVPDGEVKPHRSVAENQHTYFLRSNKTTEIMADSAVRAFVMAGARPHLEVRHVLEECRQTNIDKPTSAPHEVGYGVGISATIQLYVVNTGNAMAESAAAAIQFVQEVDYEHLSGGLPRNILVEGGRLASFLYSTGSVETIYPGTEVFLGRIQVRTLKMELFKLGHRPTFDLSIRWWAYARNFSETGLIEYSRDELYAPI